ncbi:protein FAM240C isoform X2 [Anabas testudineus]|uniref:protein FAM240C isoform X2 n=1 Tax=Anabas testudineus TaxID=64144 RepID=UPI000E45CB30|nr:protein FAM240C isoform X2 [Anabas testudineus]
MSEAAFTQTFGCFKTTRGPGASNRGKGDHTQSRSDHLQLRAKMNLALIHDRLHIKSFWEKKIDTECQHVQSEEQRRNKSALKKLRGEWLVRLENRNKHLKKLNDSFKGKGKEPDQT